MAIDTSIITGMTQVNPLQAISQGLQIKGQQLQQGQLQQQIQANQATSAAYKQATDPATGRVDYNKLLGALSQGPAAYNLSSIQGQILDQQKKQVDLDQGTYDLAVKRTAHLQNGLGTLLNKTDLSPQDVINLGAQAVKDGTATADQTVRYIQDIPQDPTQLRAWVKQKWIQSLDDHSQLQALMPTTQVVDNGGAKQVVAIDNLTGKPQITGTIQNTMTPGEAATPTPVFDPATGTMRNVTKQQFSNMASMQPGMQQPMQGRMPQGGDGRYPQQGAAQQQMPGMGANGMPMQQQPQAMGVQTGPSMGAQTAAEVVAKGNGESVLNLQKAAGTAPQTIYQLQNMREALKNFDSGPTSDWAAQAKALALQLGPSGLTKGLIDPQTVASQEEFKKYATQIAQAAASSYGGGSDSQLASFLAATPNTKLSNLGNDQLIATTLATQRGLLAKNQAWQAQGLGAEKYGSFEQDWSRKVDPRVFAVPDMSQDERVKTFQSMSPKDQKAFSQSYNYAVKNGLIQRPGS